jgi:cytochrome c-type biogenesis protein CcmH
MMRHFILGLTIPGLLVLGLFMPAVYAADAVPLQANTQVEAQVQRLAEELRCLVCQNQTLADSHAGLAMDLKQEIREMATQGMSDAAITDYLVTRYGDFIRYRPPLKSSTALLWFGPFALLLLGSLGLVLMLRRRQRESTDMPLTPVEARKVKELLDKES